MLVIVGGPGDPRFATVENGGVSTSEREREREEQGSGWSRREFRKDLQCGNWRLAPGASHSVPPEPF